MTRGPCGRVRLPAPLVVAVACALALGVTGLLAFEWSPARSVDAQSLAGFTRLSAHPRLADIASWVASGATLLGFAVGGAILAAVALARRRHRLAVAVPITLIGAVGTAELLKHVVIHTRHSHFLTASDQIAASSWPSGHAAAATTLALCAVVVAPPVLRTLTALLAAAASIGVGYVVLVLGWHFPSDVVGGILVAAGWVWVMLAVVSWRERERPPGRGDDAVGRPTTLTAVPIVAVGIGALGLCAGLVGLHASLGASTVAAAVLIALLVASLTVGLVAALRALGRAGGPSSLA